MVVSWKQDSSVNSCLDLQLDNIMFTYNEDFLPMIFKLIIYSFDLHHQGKTVHSNVHSTSSTT